MDRAFIRSSAAVGMAQVTARALGILFSFVVAKLYAPAQFGEVRYILALAGVLAIPTTSLPRTLSRFVAKHRVDGQEEADRYFSNSVVLLSGSLIGVLAAALAATLARHGSVGLFAVCIGGSLVVVYFDLLRAVERFYALALFYISANAVQLIAVIAAAAVHVYSETLVLVAYGLSCIPPLLCIELARPSPLRFRPRSVSGSVLKELTRFSLPLILANASYTVWFSIDLLLVEHVLHATQAGNYALAKTITTIFVFVPYATTTAVLPRFVHAQRRNGVAYLRAMLLVSAVTSVALLALLAVGGKLLLHVVFQHKYPTAALALTPLSLGMGLYSLYLVLETWVVSIGKPLLHAISMSAALVVTVSGDLILIPRYGQMGAGVGFTLGAATGLGVLAYATWLSRPGRQVAARRKHPGPAASSSRAGRPGDERPYGEAHGQARSRTCCDVERLVRKDGL